MFPFVYVCDLLEDLEGLERRDDPLLPHTLRKLRTERTLQWFARHRGPLDSLNTDGKSVIRIFQPELFNQGRAYGFTANCVELAVRRALNLPSVLLPELQRWRSEPALDLGACVRKVMQTMIDVSLSVTCQCCALSFSSIILLYL